MEIDNELRQAEYLIDALGWCSDEDQYDLIFSMAREILVPYWKKSDPRSLWLKAGMSNLGEKGSPLPEEEFERHHLDLVRIAAEGGCPEAQYRHGVNLEEIGDQRRASEFYLKAAKEDYAPAQWCYGLDLLNGNCVEKNVSLGLSYIRLAAEQRYDYAVEFMIDTYSNGKHGLRKDERELSKWEKILPFCEYRY